MEGNLKVPFISLHTVKPKKAFGLRIHLPNLNNVYARQDIKLLLFSSLAKHEYLSSLPVLIIFRVKQNGKLRSLDTLTWHLKVGVRRRFNPGLSLCLQQQRQQLKKLSWPIQVNPAGTLNQWQGECGCFLIDRLPEPDRLLSYGTLLLCDMRSLKSLQLGRTYPVSCHQCCMIHSLTCSIKAAT